MHLTITRLSVALAGIAAVATLVGCDSSYPQPSEDAVYYFVANTRANGKTRVCWPEGQKYALAIAAADVTLRSKLDELHHLVGYEADWAPDDPRWRDEAAIAVEIEALQKLAGEGAEERKGALGDLRAAVDADLPKGLNFADQAARDAFRNRLWDELNLEDETLEEHIARYEKVLDTRLRLLSKSREILAAAARADDKEKSELEALHAETHAVFEQWYEIVRTERERYFEQAAACMREISPVIAKLDKQKQREDYNLLDNQRECVKRELERMKRGLHELIRAEQAKIKKCKRADKIAPTVIEFHERQLKRFENELNGLEERTQAILNQSIQP